ncbi:putative Monocarboxylate transporter 6 [Hypsibius exemplaris]|uniref:Monocarboxylate transporter 6 n=1 Tax=Hypsibius exemplaris TaxID=2072580 RepID=A0A1W0XFB4_HYPEX|nr:putative Monocarboxylate transporter 6 [Hypsibius exemplaris]
MSIPRDVDRGWAWIVLLAACLMTATSDGLRNSSGIFYSQFIDSMNLSRPQAASVVAILNAMFLLPGPLAALLAQKIGTRWTINLGAILTAIGLFSSAFVHTYGALLATFGGITGFGLCLSFMPAMGGLPVWFTKYRQVAPALCMTVGALGIFAMAPLIQLLVDAYSWRGAAIVVSAICLNACFFCGTVFFPVKPTGPGRPAPDRRAENKWLFASPAYLLHLTSGFFMFGIPLFWIFIVRHVTNHRGYTHQEGAILVSVCGISSLLGRMLFVLFNFVPRLATKSIRFILFNLSSLFAGIACGLMPIFWNFYIVAGICAVMGFMQGVKVATMLNVTMDITTPARFQTGYGYFSLVVGLTVLAIPPLAGYLAEVYRCYDPVFYLSAAALGLSCAAGCLSQYYEDKRQLSVAAADGLGPLHPLPTKPLV